MTVIQRDIDAALRAAAELKDAGLHRDIFLGRAGHSLPQAFADHRARRQKGPPP